MLRAYYAREVIVGATLTGPPSYRADLEALFETHEAAFVLVRFPTYACYGFRIENERERELLLRRATECGRGISESLS